MIIRECLNKEVADLTTVATFVEGLFGRYEEDSETRVQLLLLLRRYVERIILESRSTLSDSSIKALAAAKTTKNEIDLFQYELVNAGAAHRGDPSNMHKKGLMDEPFLFNLPSFIASLNANRSTRLAALLTGYPAQHWIIIGLLYASVVLCFLEESDGTAFFPYTLLCTFIVLLTLFFLI